MLHSHVIVLGSIVLFESYLTGMPLTDTKITWMIFGAITGGLVIGILIAARTFNTLYLKNKYGRILQMENRHSTENLISLKSIIYGLILGFLVPIMVILGVRVRDHNEIPFPACCTMVICSIVLGGYAFKPVIREYFYHKLKQVYDSSVLYLPVVYLPDVRPLRSRRHRGVVAPI